MNKQFTKKKEKAIADLKRELTNPDKREYFSNWFAHDLGLILNIINERREVTCQIM